MNRLRRAPAIVGLLVAFGSASLGAAPAVIPRATHAFTLLAQDTPRFVTSGSVTTVRLTLRNDGTTTWTSAGGFHVSYHWKTVRGRVVVLDGLRATVPGAIPPGGTVTVNAAIQAPSAPGMYSLQWDMVQENVTWFSDRDPSPPGWQDVIVMPDTAIYATGAMPLFALLVWFSIRRSRSRGRDWIPARVFLVPPDALWAFGSLVAVQLLFLLQTGIHAAPTAIWATVLLAASPVAAVLLLPRAWRAWGNWAVVAAGTTVLFADLVYFRYFGDLLSLAAMRSSGQAGDLWDSVRGLLDRSDLWWLVNLPCGWLLARAVSSLPPAAPALWRQRIAAVAGVLALVAVGQPVGATELLHDTTLEKVFQNTTVVERLGPLGFHAFDVWHAVESTWLQPVLTPAELAETSDWFARRAPHRAGAGPAFGAARGMNVLVIQVESMQRFVVGLRIDGQEVTPNLNRWRRDALWFSATTDQTGEGRSSDAEFITMTSLLPTEHGAAAFRYASNHYVGLPAVLAAHGYTNLSAVPLDGRFWNSRITHVQYGIPTNLFQNDFTIGERVGWGLNDRDFFREMMPRLQALHQPFFAWLLTLSLHYPFDGLPDDLRTLKLGPLEGTSFGNYLDGMHFFDAALGDLEHRLQTAGLLDRTIIVVYGDHDAGFGWNGRLSPYIGHAESVADWVVQDAVPLFIRVPGRPALTGERALPAGLTDVAPTVLALLGIDPASLPYVGRNLLGAPGDEPVVRPYGSWVDSQHVFLAQSEHGDRCADPASGASVPAAACDAENALALHERDLARRVVMYDLQTKLVAHPAATVH